MDLIFEDNAGKFGKSYCRNYNRTKTAVQDQLAKLYSADQCQLVSSGINAIACVLDCLARTPPPKKGIKLLLVSDEMYCDTIKVVKFVCKKSDLTYKVVDVCDIVNLQRLFKEHMNSIVGILTESCSNPSGKIFDTDWAAKMSKKYSPKCNIIVDNTWLTAINYNPIDHGANTVVESLSKYVSEGKCIGGMVASDKKFMRKIGEWCWIHGQYISPRQSQIYLDGLKTLETRVAIHGQNSMRHAEYLSELKVDVLYPMLKSHDSFEYAKDINHGPGVLFFRVPGNFTPESARDKLRKNKYIAFQTSFGSRQARFDPWPYVTGKGMWVRLASGTDEKNVEKGLRELLS